MVWFRFMNGRISTRKYQADSFNWKHRGMDFDIKEATIDD